MGPLEIRLRVEHFVAVFHDYICKVSTVSLGEHDERYRKILYFSILEGLAKARYPKKRPGKAFASFVVNDCDWSRGDKVSIPHLSAALERTDEPRFDQIRQEVFAKLRSWGSGGPNHLDADLDKRDLQRLWPTDADRMIPIPELNLGWPALQHRALLYAYRSKLSHESREPTLSFEEECDQEPFYESVHDTHQGPDQLAEWHLVYPSGFLLRLCHSGLDSLRRYFLDRGGNPYDSFKFGRYLIEKLNDEEKYPIKRPLS